MTKTKTDIKIRIKTKTKGNTKANFKTDTRTRFDTLETSQLRLPRSAWSGSPAPCQKLILLRTLQTSPNLVQDLQQLPLRCLLHPLVHCLDHVARAGRAKINRFYFTSVKLFHCATVDRLHSNSLLDKKANLVMSL